MAKLLRQFIESLNQRRKKIESDISKKDLEFLQENFLVINEIGKYLEGIDGFEQWCQRRNLPLKKTIQEFIITKTRYLQYRDSMGLINGYDKLVNTKGFEAIYLDDLFYFDFYDIEGFGKTPLETILHYAKQGQNKILMKILLGSITEKLSQFVKDKKINAIGIVPPTIKRNVQLMKYIEANLNLNLPILDIQKVNNLIAVPQKSLSKLDERIANADQTFLVKSNTSYRNLLLIDDAIGSGATLNQISKKIKSKKIAHNIIGIAIVGSFIGFDIITDV